MTNQNLRKETYVPAKVKNNYGEFNLYGKLLEVALGSHKNLRFQPLDQKLQKVYASVIQPELSTMLEEANGDLLAKTHPEFSQKLEQETQALKAAYEAFGVKVHITREATESEINRFPDADKAFTQVFAAEPLWVVGRNVLENVWASDIAWASIAPVRELHQPHIDNDDSLLHYTAPQPGLVRDYIYEGGDVLNLGDGRVLVATGPSSTNERGAKWVKKMLEHDGYRVEIIELPEVGIHHLFAVICVAGPKLVIAYEDSFPNGLPEFMGDFDVIWANREEALATGPCASMLDEKHILMPEETPRLNEELIKRGVTPVTVPFKHHALMCGGIRCKTSVIRREIV